MAVPFPRLWGAWLAVVVLATAGPGHAGSTGRGAAEAEFRRRAAEFKKLRQRRQHDRDWDRRFGAAVSWLFEHGEIIADGRRSCAEIERRLGRSDRSPLDLDIPPERRHRDALVYSATTHDAIGGGRISLQISCNDGKATSLELDVRAS